MLDGLDLIFLQGAVIMLNPFKTRRIDFIYFFSFALLLLLFLVIVIRISYEVSANELVRSTSFQQQLLLLATNEQLYIQMRSIEQLSLTTANNMGMDDILAMNPDHRYDYYRMNQDLTNHLLNVINGTGTVYGIDLFVNKPLFSTKSSIRYYPLSELQFQDWYPAIENADYNWIGEHEETNEQQKSDVISFARKITLPRGQLIGVLVIHLKASNVKGLLLNGDNNAKRFLYDSGNRLIVKTGEEQLDIAGIGDQLTLKSGYRQFDEEGTLLVWSKHPWSSWVAVELTPWNKVIAGTRDLLQTLMLTGAATILIGLLVTMFISRQFIKPVSVLLQAMIHYKPMKERHRLPADYVNEFGRLFRGFDQMADRIEQLYERVEEEHKKQTASEIKALQAMINPHFIYNTLDQVNWMAAKEGQESISEVLEKMGKILRIGLSNGHGLITLREELNMIQCYMEIQSIKWAGKCNYHLEVEPALLDYYIPKVTLLPFIENAFIHGFHGRASGQIEIKVSSEGYAMNIVIRDDGKGIHPKWESRPPRTNGGYGLRNVKERIHHYFGGDFGFTIVQHDEGGTMVRLKLPILSSRE